MYYKYEYIIFEGKNFRCAFVLIHVFINEILNDYLRDFEMIFCLYIY